MKSRRRIIIFLVLAAVTLLVLWHFTNQTIVSPSQPAARQESNQNKQESVKTTVSSAVDRRITPARRRSTAPDAVHEYVQKSTADPQYDWKQPINFYGKVVDENNQVVADAKVDFGWNDLSEQGRSTASTMSDSNGLFSLLNRTGKRLFVDVSKEGYYSSRQNPLAFEYANPADGLFTPDPNQPVIFHLQKKGEGVDLITSGFGIRPDFPISIPRDGTPVKVDFMNRKVGDAGQMQIVEKKPEYKDWKKADAWSFKMEIPDGGFVEQNDEFPFEAPESGYESIVQFEFRKEELNWTTSLKKDYYIKFGNPPHYGRLTIQTGISYGGAILTYAINPTGSRYLEPKSNE